MKRDFRPVDGVFMLFSDASGVQQVTGDGVCCDVFVHGLLSVACFTAGVMYDGQCLSQVGLRLKGVSGGRPGKREGKGWW